MKKSMLKTVIMVGAIGLLFVGCGRSFQTQITPYGINENKAVIVADHESTTSYLFQNSIKRANFRYSLAVSAQLAKDKGFKYFSIVSPSNTVDELESGMPKTMKEAVNVCDETFNMLITEAFEGCGSMVTPFRSGVMYRYDVMVTIEYHNENRNDGATFNAEQILKEAKDYGLNEEYFRKIQR